MEGAPNPESAEVSKSEVVESLKQNPEDLTSLIKFMERREAEVTNSRESLTLNIEVAEIYRDAGLYEASKEAYEQAAEQAWQEGEDSLSSDLQNEADEAHWKNTFRN